MNLQQRFCYAPDGGQSAAAAPTAKAIRLPKLPRKDADFGAVATKVAEKWSTTSTITLVWATATGFAAKAAQYNATFGSRQAAGSNRPAQTQTLDALDQTIEKGISQVKNYIHGKWEDKTAATAQYARYGIVHRDKGYELPRDRQQRLVALPLTLQAIIADGFDSRTYGKDFWTDMQTRYAAALKAAGDSDSSVSSGVSDKNVLKAELTKMMEGLQFVIRGNYPDTYEAVYREWGWQKEDY